MRRRHLGKPGVDAEGAVEVACVVPLAPPGPQDLGGFRAPRVLLDEPLPQGGHVPRAPLPAAEPGPHLQVPGTQGRVTDRLPDGAELVQRLPVAGGLQRHEAGAGETGLQGERHPGAGGQAADPVVRPQRRPVVRRPVQRLGHAEGEREVGVGEPQEGRRSPGAAGHRPALQPLDQESPRRRAVPEGEGQAPSFRGRLTPPGRIPALPCRQPGPVRAGRVPGRQAGPGEETPRALPRALVANQGEERSNRRRIPVGDTGLGPLQGDPAARHRGGRRECRDLPPRVLEPACADKGTGPPRGHHWALRVGGGQGPQGGGVRRRRPRPLAHLLPGPTQKKSSPALPTRGDESIGAEDARHLWPVPPPGVGRSPGCSAEPQRVTSGTRRGCR